MPLDTLNPPIRIVGSAHTLSPGEIGAVLQVKDTRGAVEHILASLNHQRQPGEDNFAENYSPKSFINSPEIALDTLEILLTEQEDIFDKRNGAQAKKIVLGIMVLLSEYFGNNTQYNTQIARNPEQQKELLKAQQKLTDTFHFIVGNIIDKDFQTSPQFGDVGFDDIIQDSQMLDFIQNSEKYPNVKHHLSTFQSIDFGDENNSHKKEAT